MNKAKPLYLLAGGRGMSRKERDPILDEVFSLAERSNPSISYVGAASRDSKPFFLFMAGYLKKAGASQVRLAPLVSKRANTEASMRIIEESDIVFMSGGDVEEGMHHIESRNMTNFFSSLYSSGKPFFGLSAGSIMLAERWVKWRDPEDDRTAETFPCLALAPVLCDTHGEEDDWEELQVLLSLSPEGSVGYGIQTGAALVCLPDGTVEARGVPVHRFLHRGNTVVRIEDLLP